MPHMQKDVDTDTAEQTRRQQDLECLTLLHQAQMLRRETEDIDRMLATLKGDVAASSERNEQTLKANHS